jgi:hypothetical protein
MNMLKTLLSLVAPAGLLRLYGGGGDGGAGDMRRMEEDRQRRVQQAVDTINRTFGAGGGALPAPSRDAFITRRPRAPGAPSSPGGSGTPGTTGAPGGWGGWGVNGDSGGGGIGGPGGWNIPAPGTPSGGGLGVNGDSGWGGIGGPFDFEDIFDEDGYNRALAEWEAGKGESERNRAAREAMYREISDAVSQTATRDLDRQYTDISKKNLFGLARSGLLGGSVDAEAGGQISELYGEGKLRASQLGQQAGSDLRVTDERTRQNLIGLAQSGLDTGTAASLAAGQMGAAAEAARAQGNSASVGRLFDDMGQAYLRNEYIRSRYPNGMPGQQGSRNPYGYSGFNPGRYTGNLQR